MTFVDFYSSLGFEVITVFVSICQCFLAKCNLFSNHTYL